MVQVFVKSYFNHLQFQNTNRQTFIILDVWTPRGGKDERYGRTFFVLQDIWSKASFVAYIGGVLTVFFLDDVFEIMVDLGSNAHGLPEGARTHGQDHELLHSKLVPSVWSTIDHIECLGKVEGKQLDVTKEAEIDQKTHVCIWAFGCSPALAGWPPSFLQGQRCVGREKPLSLLLQLCRQQGRFQGWHLLQIVLFKEVQGIKIYWGSFIISKQVQLPYRKPTQV